jgi:hypothetical protein
MMMALTLGVGSGAALAALHDSNNDHIVDLTFIDRLLGEDHLMDKIENEKYYVYGKTEINNRNESYDARIISKNESLDGWEKLGLYQPKPNDNIFLFYNSTSKGDSNGNFVLYDYKLRSLLYNSTNHVNYLNLDANYIGILDDITYYEYKDKFDFLCWSYISSGLDYKPLEHSSLVKK